MFGWRAVSHAVRCKTRCKTCRVFSAQAQLTGMPAFFLDVLCPGVSPAKRCEWSSDIQGDAAFIDQRQARCQMCKALANEACDEDELGLQLGNLYCLDPDVFEDARLELRSVSEELCRCVSRAAFAGMLASLPLLPCKLDAQRRDALVSASLRLTPQVTADVVEGMAASLSCDTCAVAALSSMRRFPVEIRASILVMACSDLALLYADLCRTKSACFHVLDQPLFFPPIQWQTALGDEYDESLVVKLSRIYSGVLWAHKLEIEHLVSALTAHRRALARLGGGSWPARAQTCLRTIAVARRMHELCRNREATVCMLDLMP